MIKLRNSYNAIQNLEKLSTRLHSDETLSLLGQLAKTADSLSDPKHQIKAAETLTFYLDPEMPDDDLHQTLFTAWKGLIRKLSVIDSENFAPLYAADNMRSFLREKYARYDNARGNAMRKFYKEIETPREIARRQCAKQFE